jgi:trans-aconitate methyltransferase
MKTWDSTQYQSSFAFVWEYGADVLPLLKAQPGERILDLGCGTGHLMGRIAEAGAEVFGIDASPAMIAQARQNFPKLKFQLIDAAHFRTDQKFDAVFSNAALHWMHDADAVAETVSLALKPGGRFVAEMGGKGNIAAVLQALDTSMRNYFPSVAEYSTVLERHGLEVELMMLFDRMTPLAGGEIGMREWIAMYRPDNRRPVEHVESELRPGLFRDGQWFADYRRLRFVARKYRYKAGIE